MGREACITILFRLPRALFYSALQRPEAGLGAVGKMQFLQDIADVGLDRFDTHDQAIGNLLVAQPFNQQV